MARLSQMDFVAYLRMVGRDYKKSGSEFTAQDYFKAARKIEALEKQLKSCKVRRKRK